MHITGNGGIVFIMSHYPSSANMDLPALSWAERESITHIIIIIIKQILLKCH